MNRSRSERWLPITGILFVVCMVVGSALSGSSPDSDNSDSKISSYLASSTKFHHAVAALFFLWAASLLSLAFWATLRARLRAAEGGTGGLSALTFGAGIASTVFNLIGVTAFEAPVLAGHDARHGHAALDPSVYRLTQDLGYPIWIMTAIIGALAVWGTAAVAWRTRVWPRWYAVVSIIVGVVCLAAITFFPLMLFGLWIVLTAIVLMVKPGVPADTAGSPARTAPAVTPAMT